MDIQNFIRNRPYLYHLTSTENAERIIDQKRLFCTNELIRMSGDELHLPIQRQKRSTHYELKIDGISYFLRDQRPISTKALGKCLTDGWTVGDFLYHLNDRVFMWPTLDRLWRHFNRYEAEHPVIFRFPTDALFAINPHVEFCRLNSGATRANSYLGGKPPARGAQTFLPADRFEFTVGNVAEITFQKQCDINMNFGFSSRPDSEYEIIRQS
ncbi:MAG: hypothetical protein AAGU19_01025 [Prolixibacteraceae bacterium]